MASDATTPLSLSLLHFNDVYHVAPLSDQAKEPVGGAARFVTLVNHLRTHPTAGPESKDLPPALVLFSGDAFNPSIESSFTRGKHMVPVLNSLNIDVACYGNHDFDFGIDVLEKLSGQCNFPWLLTNVVDRESGGNIARASPYHLLEHGGLKIGFIGLVESEWLETLPSLPPSFQYQDFVAAAQTWSRRLRSPEIGVDLVIALTHMRLPNDIKLATACPDEIDLILGGHDHMYAVGNAVELVDRTNAPFPPGVDQSVTVADPIQVEPAVWAGPEGEVDPPGSATNAEPTNTYRGLRIVKSGTDFRDLSEVHLSVTRAADRRTRIAELKVYRHAVTSKIPADLAVERIVADVTAGVSKHIDKVIGHTLTPWDARSQRVRIEESAIGNLLGDLMRCAFPHTDVALACGGAIRSDSVYGPGDITMRTIMELFPFEDPMVVVRLSGDQLRQALENGVSKYPAQEGRFPQISGMRIQFDPRLPPGARIVDVQILVPGTTTALAPGDGPAKSPQYVPLDPQTMYNVATREYMADGHDGYDVLKEGERVVDDESGVLISALFRRYFLGLKYTRALQFKSKYFPSLEIPTHSSKVHAVNDLSDDKADLGCQFRRAKGCAHDMTSPHASVDDSGLSAGSSGSERPSPTATPDSQQAEDAVALTEHPTGAGVLAAIEAFTHDLHTKLNRISAHHRERQARLEHEAREQAQLDPALAAVDQGAVVTSTSAPTGPAHQTHERHGSAASITSDAESVHNLLVKSCTSHPFSTTKLLEYTCSGPLPDTGSAEDGPDDTSKATSRLSPPPHHRTSAKDRWRKLQRDVLVRKVLGRPKRDIIKDWCAVAPTVEGRIVNVAAKLTT
ncbi:hypothetical protein IWQ60_001819 [Tieghemiomyces parasiticus]|uniref:5'-nucleotidase n=1 Tax=Tieghemiomyces parasiticus TaxID=78921 RepID=A0A9W8ADX6_9FUNG|nr:hypothetical protein IWQ60_001819 [Tieghemiomyces parasiticus]